MHTRGNPALGVTRRRSYAMLVLCALPIFGLCAYADGARAQASPVPTVEEMIERLKARTATPDELRSHAVIVEGRQERAETAPSLDLDINFEYASARLTPDARLVLDNLGQALTDPVLRDSRIRIAGHTDARGSRAYNLKLSLQRARAVADYLVRVHRIDTGRLAVDGLGFGALLDPAHPDSPVNRRVQITNLGS